LKIATWNVNSLKVRLPHVLDWLAGESPDVLALQETKTRDQDFPVDAFRERGKKGARGDQRLDLAVRNRRARLAMRGHRAQHLRPPGKVLEELARQLDGIPGHAVDAGNRGIVDFGEQVMQGMAELME
jgi:Endonuclease/Exonuclease/phosphatase family